MNAQNYGSAPVAVKIFLIIMLIVAILAAAWFALINGKRDEIAQAEAQQKVLLEEYREKEAKARYLDEYKAQVAQMEVDFAELLGQLPKGKEIAELNESIAMIGSGSGIRFQEIVADPEVEREFFVEQPIRITALGEYHRFGDFMSGIATLPRIITMHNFEVKNQQPSLDVMPQVQMVLETKTYRSKEAATASTDTATGDKK
ncbi:MAG: type 4a pilus biogenesis protein PilO [Moraxella sp.]|nr:type 4a pilus biogenesis protein PilO [Moraxella sp.]